jgi:SH3 domain protein
MKRVWAGVLVLVVTAATALAQTVYINDVVKVTLRSGPGYDNKIVSVLSSGDVVDVIERGEEWSLVRIPEGPNGWIVTRLLSQKEPNTLKIRRLEAQLAALQADDGSPESVLKEENLKLENALTEARFELEAARQAYAALENGASDHVHIRQSLDGAQARIKELEAELTHCQGRLDDQELAAELRWFLGGAGVLLAGLLIGLKVQRRQRSGLL